VLNELSCFRIGSSDRLFESMGSIKVREFHENSVLNGVG
jgi:hypothetical protein